MDAIESKVQQLKELSRKQKKLNEIKQDIADILGNANMDEKKQIAEKMSKMEYENMNQARNLQFIVPHVVKELYEHNGPKGEFIIPKKVEEVKPIEPAVIEEPKVEVIEPVKPVVIEPEIKKEEPEIIEEPKVIEPVKSVVIEEPEIKKEEPKIEVTEPVIEEPEIISEDQEETQEEKPVVTKKKKRFGTRKEFFQKGKKLLTSKKKLKKAEVIKEIETTKKNIENIQNEKAMLKKQLRESTESEREKLQEREQNLLTEAFDKGEINEKEIQETTERRALFIDLIERLGIRIIGNEEYSIITNNEPVVIEEKLEVQKLEPITEEKKEETIVEIEKNLPKPYAPDSEKDRVNENLYEFIDERGLIFKIGEPVVYIDGDKREYYGKITGFNGGKQKGDWCGVYTDKSNQSKDQRPTNIVCFEHATVEEIAKNEENNNS